MSVVESVKSVMVPVHPEGLKFVAIFAVIALILWWIWTPLGVVGGILSVWCAYFFRNPERHTPTRAGLVISPADGVVQMILDVTPPPELELGDEPRTRISIFMNVFNVHVNRSPMTGTIVRKVYTPGAFVNASLDKASEDNERMSIVLATETGKSVAFVQIAGLVARRILSFVNEGDSLQAGERFGLIRFGSRVDVYLDDGMVPMVSVGQLAIAGETVIADEQSSEEQRWAEIR
ncbi:MAG: phosphatidylserine decarboxylase [Alphaproteobacteria bacterium]|nr:MAG: phosphatidylserine decarboxylase [Alphaproteobacteria bacterium]